MALAFDLDAGVTTRVAAAAAQAWARAGVTAVQTPLAAVSGTATAAPAVLSAEHGIVECVADGDYDAIAVAVRALAADGWRVAVLAPTAQMGSAHRVLRGLPVRVQPWWTGADDSVMFGVPEVP